MCPQEILVHVETETEIVQFSAEVPRASPGCHWKYCMPQKGQRYVDEFRKVCIAPFDFQGSWFLTEVHSWSVPDWLPHGWVVSQGRGHVFWDSRKPIYHDGQWVLSSGCVNISELLAAWNHPEPSICNYEGIWEVKPEPA